MKKETRNEDGELHSFNGEPAVEYTNGTKHWYKNGTLYRENGPAVEYASGHKEYWTDGENVSEECFKEYLKETEEPWPNSDNRIDVIGQNGNEGLHYEQPEVSGESGESEEPEVPAHYDNTIQPWEYMESVMNEHGFIGYLQGNVIKYISRFQEKGGRADLLKAKHYINKLLNVYY